MILPPAASHEKGRGLRRALRAAAEQALAFAERQSNGLVSPLGGGIAYQAGE